MHHEGMTEITWLYAECLSARCYTTAQSPRASHSSLQHSHPHESVVDETALGTPHAAHHLPCIQAQYSTALPYAHHECSSLHVVCTSRVHTPSTTLSAFVMVQPKIVDCSLRPTYTVLFGYFLLSDVWDRAEHIVRHKNETSHINH